MMVLLIALLLPALNKAKETARHVVCTAQMSGIVTAFHIFASDHDTILPGNVLWWSGDEAWQKCWLGDELFFDGAYGYQGTLLPYIGSKENARRLYRCPSLDVSGPGSGIGSNGYFDYSSVSAFSGASLEFLPLEAEFPRTSSWARVLTPIIVEEHLAEHGNVGWLDPAISNRDRMGNWHLSGSTIFATVDGSVQQFEADDDQQIDFGEGPAPAIGYWFATGSSGQWWRLNGWHPAPSFGMWNQM